ncbi:MAG TPA: fused response regulator/thioredoxin-disulfide reductase [Nocardioides bacterium]|uniref:FAD-dependent oxidoreductase n=1 Tax=uncultured Nocardioides sp. TaxID=198441 RepID=UPI000EC48CA3|nr:FAD-dependent oxidoreductase [uncultured Nocardioides sp.]HCB06765.1 fused response regulator/thioredoxin-disulfide reductase [Nocardioides sp.]HRD62172.1 FAD-dependent oxidoreductase [Nocardioides sp.]
MAEKPTILAVDDDPAVSRAVTRDLRSRYGADYRVVSVTSGREALEVLAELALRDRPVALVASDQRMPEMTGIEVLAEVRRQSPDTKLLLLTAYADTEVAITAINEIGLDYYLLKPWDPPEERLYPVVDDLLGDWQSQHPDRSAEVRVVGHRWSDTTVETKAFLARNHVPYRWLDVERDEEGRQLVELARQQVDDQAGANGLPLVLLPDGAALRAPSSLQLAEALGLRTRAEQPLYDLCIVGAGPAGLAAAVYAASEGLRTVVVERDAPGGQAGQSASIENYLGFPKGLSGADLTHRAVAQASRFGAEMVLARDVVGFEQRGPVRAVRLAGGPDVEARAVLVATGVSYRRLDAEGLETLGSRGIYYGATASEAGQCAGDEVYVVGAANSAGQAVLNLARFASKVVLLVRGPSLEATMSQYLVARIRAADNVEVRLRTQVVGAQGEDHLEQLTLCDEERGVVEDVATSWLFVFIGASPRTDWLGDGVARDDKGFVLTGPELVGSAAGWPLPRSPFALETSVPGVFAAGDVRQDSMKRVASAVGEGAMAVYLVHRYLATI